MDAGHRLYTALSISIQTEDLLIQQPELLNSAPLLKSISADFNRALRLVCQESCVTRQVVLKVLPRNQAAALAVNL